MKITIIEPCNFKDYPLGGQLTFSKQLITAFGNNLILIGITTEKMKIGKWTKLILENTEYDYFPYLYLPKSTKKPIIPLRLRNYFALRKFKKEIIEAKLLNVITQSPDSLLAIFNFKFKNLCFVFAGIENPLSISRYKYAHRFTTIFDRIFFPKLHNIKLMLAAADNNAIDELVIRSKGYIKKENIYKFPTRVDTNIFKKIDKNNARNILLISEEKLLIVTTGRLGWFKGWKFLIDSFKLFKLNNLNAILFFIGTGEDEYKIKSYLNELNLADSVILVGFQSPINISYYLNAADLFVMGSYKEGWSTSLIEAIVCGTPSCVTNFSSAKDIIENGITGYVSEIHNESHFAHLMAESLKIDRTNIPRKIDIDKFTVSNLKKDLLSLWTLE